MEGFAERLAVLVSEHKSANSFAKETGVGQTNLRKYLAGTTPGLDKVVQIAKVTGTSITWLATGDGPRDSTTDARQPISRQQVQGGSSVLQLADREKMEDEAFVLLPRYEVEASAGPGIVAAESEPRDFIALEVGYLRTAGIDPRHALLLQVKGRSMMPTLVDGEWIIVDASKTRVINGDVYAIVLQGEVRVKRLRKEGSAHLLVSDNLAEGYAVERIEGPDLDDFRVIGRVERHIRSL